MHFIIILPSTFWQRRLNCVFLSFPPPRETPFIPQRPPPTPASHYNHRQRRRSDLSIACRACCRRSTIHTTPRAASARPLSACHLRTESISRPFACREPVLANRPFFIGRKKEQKKRGFCYEYYSTWSNLDACPCGECSRPAPRRIAPNARASRRAKWLCILLENLGLAPPGAVAPASFSSGDKVRCAEVHALLRAHQIRREREVEVSSARRGVDFNKRTF